MQTTKLKKKGFTLVELVIVVAVIAVLSAILVPTIGCVVEDAKETNDMATVRLLNVALTEDQAENDKPATMTDALAAMAKKGYDIEKLTPRSSGEILWDSVNNRFALYKDGTPLDTSTAAADKVNLWKIVDNISELANGEYSYYLKGDSISGDIGTIKTGLDVGNNTGITAIEYKPESTTAQSVVIRTNGGTLTIDAANDTVAHYGDADKVIVTAVDLTNCYHEYGVVNGNIEVTQGRVVISAEAKVESVIATAADVAIDVKNTTTEVKAKEGIDLTGKVEGATVKTVKYVSTVQELQNAEGEVVLNADLVGTVIFKSGKTIVLDANGHSINGIIILINNGNLTIKGNGYFSYSGNLLNVGYTNAKNAKYSTGGTLTIESGTFTADEACIANLTGVNEDKSTITINGGTFTSLDNGVLMSNGDTTMQGANWFINGGTFNCNIKTSGYVALGMYMSNTDVAVINGGTFNVKNGVGIVCRSGNTTINSGVVINIVNDGTIVSGIAGNSKILLNVASYIVKDEQSNYHAGAPVIKNNSNYTVIEAANIKAE